MESALKLAPLHVMPVGLGAGVEKGGGAEGEVKGVEGFEQVQVGEVGRTKGGLLKCPEGETEEILQDTCSIVSRCLGCGSGP